MDVRYTLHQIRFVWDRSKAVTNLRKHKLPFETSCEVFFDPFLRVIDAGIIDGESREAVIGMTESWRMLFVVYVEVEDVIRIISARPVDKTEREFYEDQ